MDQELQQKNHRQSYQQMTFHECHLLQQRDLWQVITVHQRILSSRQHCHTLTKIDSLCLGDINLQLNKSNIGLLLQDNWLVLLYYNFDRLFCG